jgi:DNA-binding response OmpR family regulator
MAKLVFCEDEAHIQKLFRIALRNSGHEIFLAADGVEGWALIEREQPDIVFTDISMPNCDGFQLVEELRRHAAFARVPVVFITAFDQHAERFEGYRLGAVDYLTKPFSPADLLEKIALLLQPQ